MKCIYILVMAWLYVRGCMLLHASGVHMETLLPPLQEFLEALSSYYFDGKAKLSDEEFETLREVGM